MTRRADLIAEIELLVREPPGSVRELYERAAPRYDEFRRLWLRLAGEAAERALLDDLRRALRPGRSVLDAGSGTGAIARAVVQLEPEACVTMLDLSPRMLERARDVPGLRVIGDVQELPFLDRSFDIVVSAWTIETVDDPLKAVAEFQRVLTPTGHVFYTFSSLPEGWLSRVGTALLRRVVESRFGATFLAPERTPWHDCGASHRVRFHGGLTTEIALRKCCHVLPEIAAGPAQSQPVRPDGP